MDKRLYIKQISQAFSNANILYKEYAKKKGISLNCLDVLYMLNDLGECSLNKIADYWGLPKQTVHSILLDLEKKGYISKEASPTDKRQNIVKLTASGQDYANLILKDLHQFELNALEKMGTERTLEMIEILESYNTYFKEELDNG